MKDSARESRRAKELLSETLVDDIEKLKSALEFYAEFVEVRPIDRRRQHEWR